jgi:DNA-binding Lrp family transcriptional regulator
MLENTIDPKKSINATSITRAALEQELAKLAINPDFFRSFTTEQLSDVLYGLNKTATSSGNNSSLASGTKCESGKKASERMLSSIDKKILKALLESRGKPSSIQLSKELDIPLATVQRRRKRLEEEFVRESYSLRYDKFGRRQITFIISLGAGEKSTIANEILSIEKVNYVSRTFGDSADLKVEAVVETNKELMDTSEKIKALPGIQKISWFESLEILGKKKEPDLAIVEPEQRETEGELEKGPLTKFQAYK